MDALLPLETDDLRNDIGKEGDLCSNETRFQFFFPGINASVYCGKGSFGIGVELLFGGGGGNKRDRFVS